MIITPLSTLLILPTPSTISSLHHHVPNTPNKQTTPLTILLYTDLYTYTTQRLSMKSVRTLPPYLAHLLSLSQRSYKSCAAGGVGSATILSSYSIKRVQSEDEKRYIELKIGR